VLNATQLKSSSLRPLELFFALWSLLANSLSVFRKLLKVAFFLMHENFTLFRLYILVDFICIQRSSIKDQRLFLLSDTETIHLIFSSRY